MKRQLVSLIVSLFSVAQTCAFTETKEPNDLELYFENNTGRKIDKWLHYFEIYDRHFSRFRGKPIKILEIGVQSGGSLQMWKKYFGDEVQVIGVDIDPLCKKVEEDRITIYIGDQEDRKFLARLKEAIGEVDIVIDDGGHLMNQQIISFEELYPIVSPNGVYLVEDLLTSYIPNLGGGYQRKGTFIEYAKKLVDQLNAWHSREPSVFSVNEFTKTTKSVHFYDSIAVFEKGKISTPSGKITGTIGLR